MFLIERGYLYYTPSPLVSWPVWIGISIQKSLVELRLHCRRRAQGQPSRIETLWLILCLLSIVYLLFIEFIVYGIESAWQKVWGAHQPVGGRDGSEALIPSLHEVKWSSLPGKNQCKAHCFSKAWDKQIHPQSPLREVEFPAWKVPV